MINAIAIGCCGLLHLMQEPAKEGSNTHTKLDTLTAEVSMLRNEIETPERIARA